MDLENALALIIEEAQRMWRFRWLGLICAWLVALGGWLVVFSLPDEYNASASVYVDAETVLKPLLQGLTVPTDSMEQVNLMTRALLSRPHLETVAIATGLNRRNRNQAEEERQLVRLREMIEVDRGYGDQVYTISYSDYDPAMAKAVVESLLNDFMADSMREDVLQSAEAQAFLEGQIKLNEQRLTEAEDRLAAFKRKNMGLMQGAGDSDYYARFQAAQSAADSLRSQVRSLTNRRQELARQLAGQEAGDGAEGANDRRSTSVDIAIGNLEAEAAQLRLRFTEQHPDVVRVKQTLADLYRIRDEELRARTAGGANPTLAVDPIYQQMKIALSAADADLAALRSQLEEKLSQVDYLRGMANTIPDIEAQLGRLNRDYNVIKTEYETLLQRLESVKMNQEIQAEKKDVQFRVIEPPHTSLEPSGPDRLRLNTMVLIAALGVGFAAAFLLGHRDPTFFSASSLRETANLPVYGLVGVYGTAAQGYRGTLWFSIAIGTLLVAYAVILAFTGVSTS